MTGGSLILSEVLTKGLASWTELEDIILGPIDMAPNITPLFSDDPNIDLTIIPPMSAGSFMEATLAVAASPSVTINSDFEVPADFINTIDAETTPFGTTLEKRVFSTAFGGMGLTQLGRIAIADQTGDYLITQNAVSLIARQSHTESLQQVIADDDGTLLSLDIGDDLTAEAITQENLDRILLSFPFVPAHTEVFLDSVSNPRTVDDIVFLPFVNYRYT